MLPKTPKAPLLRKLTLTKDDPFIDFLVNQRQESPNKKDGSPVKGVNFFPDFDGTKDSAAYDDQNGFICQGHQHDEVDSISSDSSGHSSHRNHRNCTIPEHAHWKTKAYYRLPPNVRNAIDVAEVKKKHTSFFYKLQNLNDKIYVFRSIFYTNMPDHQRRFYEKKRTQMIERLANKKQEFQAKMEKYATPSENEQTRDTSTIQLESIEDSKNQSILGIHDDDFGQAQIGMTALQMIDKFKQKRGMTPVQIETKKRPPLYKANSFNIRKTLNKKPLRGLKSMGDAQNIERPSLDHHAVQNQITEAAEQDEINSPQKKPNGRLNTFKDSGLSVDKEEIDKISNNSSPLMRRKNELTLEILSDDFQEQQVLPTEKSLKPKQSEKSQKEDYLKILPKVMLPERHLNTISDSRRPMSQSDACRIGAPSRKDSGVQEQQYQDQKFKTQNLVKKYLANINNGRQEQMKFHKRLDRMIFNGLDKPQATLESKKGRMSVQNRLKPDVQGVVNVTSKENALFSAKLKKVRKMAASNTPHPNDFDAILNAYDLHQNSMVYQLYDVRSPKQRKSTSYVVKKRPQMKQSQLR